MVKTAEQVMVAQTSRVGMASGRRHILAKQFSKCAVVTFQELEDTIEDAELNAIANERAKGPFVRVSLDDL